MKIRNAHSLAGSKPLSLEEVRSWLGWKVDDLNGSLIGRLEDVIADETGTRPAWLVINEFRFGRGRRFVAPAYDASGSGGRVWLPLDREFIQGSAGMAGVRHTPQAERRMQEYFHARPALLRADRRPV